MSEPCIKRKKRDQLYTTQRRERVKRKVIKKAHGYTLREQTGSFRGKLEIDYTIRTVGGMITHLTVEEEREKEKEKSYLYRKAHGKQRTFKKFNSGTILIYSSKALGSFDCFDQLISELLITLIGWQIQTIETEWFQIINEWKYYVINKECITYQV